MMGQEQGLGPREALEAVRLETAAQQPSHAFLAGGDTRMGDFILLVDSDTRVPCDCILPVVTELLRSPHVAFMQHYTTPLQVRNLFFLHICHMHCIWPWQGDLASLVCSARHGAVPISMAVSSLHPLTDWDTAWRRSAWRTTLRAQWATLRPPSIMPLGSARPMAPFCAPDGPLSCLDMA